ncbi:MAG: dTDP-4-dehydrorhamnose reductase [Saprospiraceae bacterium]|nr:dTDP-4-dehydrorhamnose reductase [Saprospiraceae bacterium]
MNIKVLITGANGQLGRSIKKIIEDFSDLQFMFLTSEQCDITDGDKFRKIIEDYNPDYLINAAAYTAVDQAESNEEDAMAVNAYALQNIGRAMAGKKCIHISSDYVYHLDKDVPYTEDMPLNAQGVYARSKAIGESILQRTSCDSIIIRTGWLYSEFGNNFLKTMLHLSETRNEINVVDDQWGCPTYATDLAYVILHIIHEDSKNKVSLKSWNKVYNYSNIGVTNWYEYACTIIKMAGKSLLINPIPSVLYPMPATRPPWGVLDTTKIKSEFSIEIPAWKVSLEKCIDILIN